MATQMQQPQTNGTRNGKFVPTQGIAEIIALAAVPGEMAPSEFGPSEVRYRLTDGRTWYVPQVIADEVNIRIAARQQFEVLKFGRNKTDLRLTPLPAFQQPAAPPPAPVPPPVAPPPSAAAPAATAVTSKLMGCFMAAIDSIREAQAYADRSGLKVTFTSEDVRSTAIACWISACKEGR